MTLRDEYVRTAVSLRLGEGKALVAIPLGGNRDAWSFMREVSKRSVRWRDWEEFLSTANGVTHS